MSATLLYFYATHSGMLTTVAVLTSLYPGVTVVLARAILRDPARTIQLGAAPRPCAVRRRSRRQSLSLNLRARRVPSRSRADA
jgi:hypothetical protein